MLKNLNLSFNTLNSFTSFEYFCQILPFNQSIYPVKFLAREQPHEFNWDELTILTGLLREIRENLRNMPRRSSPERRRVCGITLCRLNTHMN